MFGPDGISKSDEELILEYRIAKAEELWRKMVTNPKQIPYFMKKIAPKFRTNLETSRRFAWVAELGDFTNNNCESINSVLKAVVEWKTQPLSTLVSLLKQVFSIYSLQVLQFHGASCQSF